MENILSIPSLLILVATGLVGLFLGSFFGARSERKALKSDLERAEAFKLNAAFDLTSIRRDCQEISRLAVGLVQAADWAEETVRKGKDSPDEPGYLESDDQVTAKMVVWNGRNKCPGCSKTGTSGVKCTNCGTIGCSDGNCKIGGSSGACKVCRKNGTKVRI